MESSGSDLLLAAYQWTGKVLSASVSGLTRNVIMLVAIIVPLMIGIELLREWRVLDRFAGAAAPVARWLGLSGKAALPLISGIVFGLAYGAGVIIEAAREDGLSRKDCTLLCVFLVACHAVIEDTLLFVPFGVNPVALLGSRILIAVLMTILLSRWLLLVERRGKGVGVGMQG